MAHADVFSIAASVTALLLAAGLIGAFALNRSLSAFRWWAAGFVLLAIAIATSTLRIYHLPPYWAGTVSWTSLYAAIALIAYGLYRQGETAANPLGRIAAGAIGLAAIAAALIAIHAPPPLWFLAGPVPTLVFLAWSAWLILRPGTLRPKERAYGLAILAGMAAIATRSIWFATDMMRTHPLHLPGLRAALDGDRPPVPRGPPPGLIDRPFLDLSPPLRQPPPVEQPLMITLITIAALIGLAVALVLRDFLASVRRMRERSTTDAMTGLLNRATFDESAARELDAEGQQPTCLALLDVDHFKRVNDTYGHQTGDRVITRLGHILGEAVGQRHIAGRIGGEEFAVILRNSDLVAARLFAEGVRASFAASDFGHDGPSAVTLSAGIALRAPGESLRSLISRADKALYAAKAKGRDRVVVSAEPAVAIAAEARMRIFDAKSA